MNIPDKYPVPYVLITRGNVIKDAEPAENKLRKPGNNGRKIAATSLMPRFGEEPIHDPVWQAPMILETGYGGLEIATFTEFAGQDRHKHETGIEIYTVLKGVMRIYIDDQGPVEVGEGDEIVVLPGTIHQVVTPERDSGDPNGDFDLIVRVHAINCFGPVDKFVQLEGCEDWVCWEGLSSCDKKTARKIKA